MRFLLYGFFIVLSLHSMQKTPLALPEPPEITVYKQELYETEEQLINKILEGVNITHQEWTTSLFPRFQRTNRRKESKTCQNYPHASPYYGSMAYRLFLKHHVRPTHIYNSPETATAGVSQSYLHINEKYLGHYFKDKHLLKGTLRHELGHLINNHPSKIHSLIKEYEKRKLGLPGELFSLQQIHELMADLLENKKPQHIVTMMKVLSTLQVQKVNEYLNKHAPKDLDDQPRIIQEKWLHKALGEIDVPDQFSSHPPLIERLNILRHLNEAWNAFNRSQKSLEDTIANSPAIDQAADILMSMKNNKK